MSWAAGKHVWKFGAELRTYRNFDGSVPQNIYGYFTIPGQVGVIGAGGGQHGFFTAEKSADDRIARADRVLMGFGN